MHNSGKTVVSKGTQVAPSLSEHEARSLDFQRPCKKPAMRAYNVIAGELETRGCLVLAGDTSSTTGEPRRSEIRSSV